MSWLLVLPLLVPFATAVLIFLAPRTPATGGWLSVLGAGLLLLAGLALAWRVVGHGPLAGQMGDWPAPFGITLVADTLSAVMVVITGIMGLAVAIYATGEIDGRRVGHGFHAFFQLLLGGVVGAFVTGDLFNLYVWFEVLLIGAFALLVLGSEPRQVDGTVRYAALNLVATMLLLTGVGFLYGLTGTLNMAHLHLRAASADPLVLSAVGAIFLVAFGIKAAAFPLYFWLPASYHTPPVAVTAIFSALLTKVGVYALVRTFTLIFVQDKSFTHGILLGAGVSTMLVGVLGAVAQNEFRRILSVHIVSQIGYMLVALALLTPLALAGLVFLLAHNIFVKTTLFLVSGIVRATSGSFELARLGGLWRARPVLAVLFLLAAFSLAGFPPFSGFWGKLVLVRAGLETDAVVAVTAALVTGLLTTFSMTKIWNEAFWKDPPEGTRIVLLHPGQKTALMLPVLGLSALALLMGLLPEPFIALALRAAEELLDPTAYVTAVLGPQAVAGANP